MPRRRLGLLRPRNHLLIDAPRSARSRHTAWLGGLVAIAMLGCVEPPAPAACLVSITGDTIQVTSIQDVDLLLMIDDSPSMAEEQLAVVAQLPRIIGILASGDRDGDGVRDFQYARSIHVGVVSSNMGAASANIDACAGVGDDGIMSSHGCAPENPSAIFEFMDDRDDPASFASDVACAVSLGTGGCDFAQQLEASLKAVSFVPTAEGTSPVTWTRPGYRPPIFAGSTFGHGSDANAGFLRPYSALAILLVTDEDDCSASDPALLDSTDPRFAPVPIGLRCSTFPDALHPIQRYVDGFIGLRSQSSLLVFAAITGIPRDAVSSGLGYDAILGLETMTERVDPALGDRLLPSCTTPSGGAAFPPRRIMQVAQGLERLGASTTVQSICSDDFTAAVDVVLEKISATLAGACLPRSLSRDRSHDGGRRCDILMLLPRIGGPAAVQHCADMPSPEAFTLERVEVTTVGGAEIRRELCRVRYVGVEGAGTVPGWFLDDGDPRLGAASMLPHGCDRRIAFSVVQAAHGAELRLECSQAFLPTTGRVAELGTRCEPGSGPDGSGLIDAPTMLTCSSGIATLSTTLTLSCDAFDSTCQLPCTSDSDCAAAGLRAWVCDHRTAGELFGAELPTELLPLRDQPHQFCVNPRARSSRPAGAAAPRSERELPARVPLRS